MIAKKGHETPYNSNKKANLTLIALYALLILSTVKTIQAQNEQRTGFNPMNFGEFWKAPDQGQLLSRKVSNAASSSIAQGIVYSAMQADPTHLKQIAGASMQGATTVEIVGTVINTVLEQAVVNKEDSLPLCITLYKNTVEELKPNSFAQIMRHFSVTDQKTVLLTMLPAVELKNLPSVVTGALYVVEWESFKEAAQELYDQMKVENKLQFKQAINLGIQKFREIPQTQN